MRHTIGLLAAMVLPAIFLLLAVVGLVDEYVAYYARALGRASSCSPCSATWPPPDAGAPGTGALVSALVTASLGLLVIWLSSLVH